MALASDLGSMIAVVLIGLCTSNGVRSKVEGDFEGNAILERYHFANNDHLRQLDLHGVMGWVRPRAGRESRVVGRDLELGRSVAFDTKDYGLGFISPDHGRAVDLGIFLANSWKLYGAYRNYWLDTPCGVQHF
jgi:hypothetical protein